MLNKILPPSLCESLDNIDLKVLQEIRFRVNKPTTVLLGGQSYYLGISGLVNQRKSAYFCDADDVQNILLQASNHSLYAVNEQLKQGFLALKNGVRFGICGQVVSENGKIITIKNFSGLNIRIPHEIKGFGEKIIDLLFENGQFQNTLIISPPATGKTTLLRDLIRLLAGTTYAKKVLVVDERNELSGTIDSVSQMDLGDFSDIMVESTKQFGFFNGIRAMNPDIIATDEIGQQSDCDAIEYAGLCGVKIIATIHAENIEQVKHKNQLLKILDLKIFDRYVVLTKNGFLPEISAVYDRNFSKIL